MIELSGCSTIKYARWHVKNTSSSRAREAIIFAFRIVPDPSKLPIGVRCDLPAPCRQTHHQHRRHIYVKTAARCQEESSEESIVKVDTTIYYYYILLLLLYTTATTATTAATISV